jgi:photosystem II stability/assembly factor-like uncharacterized protein
MNTVLLRCCGVWFGAVACVGPSPSDAQSLSTASSWWQPTAPLPVASSLRGLAAVDRQVVWVGGADGALWRTVDGGASWHSVAPANEPAADFRDVHAFDRDTAVVMAAGTPGRLYRTTDGGGSWTRVLLDERPATFFDAIAFAGPHGVLVGDPIDGRFCVWTSADAGASWQAQAPERLPPALPGEAAFAASGSCVAVTAGGAGPQYHLLTGGPSGARLLQWDAAGYQATVVPLRAATASQGGFGLALGPGQQLVAVGGDYAAPFASDGTGACSTDGGATWSAVVGGLGGFRSAAIWRDGERLLAVGSHGTSISVDAGRSWRNVDAAGFHALAVGGDGSVWAAGGGGRVAGLRARW